VEGNLGCELARELAEVAVRPEIACADPAREAELRQRHGHLDPRRRVLGLGCGGRHDETDRTAPVHHWRVVVDPADGGEADDARRQRILDLRRRQRADAEGAV
jgi:hypothetical protein